MKRRPTTFFAPTLMLVAGGLATGCTLFKAVTMPVQLAATGIVAAGETAGAVVSASGRLASGAVRAVGSTAAVGMEEAARLAQDGTVTLVAASSGQMARVAWQPGMTLAASTVSARMQLGRRGIELLRAGKPPLTATSREAPALALLSGDVVRLLD